MLSGGATEGVTVRVQASLREGAVAVAQCYFGATTVSLNVTDVGVSVTVVGAAVTVNWHSVPQCPTRSLTVYGSLLLG